MPSERRQVTARSFYAEALLGRAVQVLAGSFNAEWNRPNVRKNLGIPEYFPGSVTKYIQGSGGAATNRWQITYEDGDETVDDAELKKSDDALPHVGLPWLKTWLVGEFPEVPTARDHPSSGAPTCSEATTLVVDPESLDGDIDELEEDEYEDAEEELESAPELATDCEGEDACEIPSFGTTPFKFKWSQVADEISHDQRVRDGGTTDIKPPRVLWDHSGLDNGVMATGYLNYFLLFFPILLLPGWVAKMQLAGSSRYGEAFLSRKRKLSVGLFLSWLGVWIFMLVNPGI
eukprot:gene20994-25189_t